MCSLFLSALGSDTTPLPSWATLNSSTWGSLKQALKGLSVEFALLADKAAQQVSGFVPPRHCPKGHSAWPAGAYLRRTAQSRVLSEWPAALGLGPHVPNCSGWLSTGHLHSEGGC